MIKNIPQNLIGKRFGKLVVIKLSNQKDKYHHRFWTCLCDCGNKKLAMTGALNAGNIKSCGCMQKGINLGKLHPHWKGDNVGYAALHDWVKRNKPKPKHCENCHKIKKLELANISQEYKRDINDFEWICRKCHQSKDGRNKKLIEAATKAKLGKKQTPEHIAKRNVWRKEVSHH